MNLFMTQRQTHKENKLMVTKGEIKNKRISKRQISAGLPPKQKAPKAPPPHLGQGFHATSQVIS